MENIDFTIALVNPYVACYYWKPEVQELFNQRFGEDRWYVYTNPVNSIPEELNSYSPGNDEEMFFNGISFAQYKLAEKQGNIAINPILLGILHAPNAWLSFLSTSMNEKQVVIYQDVSYNFYQQVSEQNLVDQDEFHGVNERLMNFTNFLIGENLKGMH